MRRLSIVGAGLVIAGLVGVRVGGPADAREGNGFTLSARADSVAVQPILSQAPLLPGGDVGRITPATAQAQLDSLQTSRAFASAPYGGDFVTTLPGTVNGLAGGTLPPLEPFPFYVTAETPTTPHSSWNIGPYGVDAVSSDDHAAGSAHIGLSTSEPKVISADAHADVSSDPKTGVLTATASTSIEPLSITPLIRLGELSSTATLTYDPAHPEAGVKKSSSLRIGTIDIGGVVVGLTDKGLELGGGTVLPVDLSAVTSLLKQLGVGFAYVPGVETATSVTSAALKMTYKTELPTVGTTSVTVLLGEVSATVDPRAPFKSDGGGGVIAQPPAVSTSDVGSSVADLPVVVPTSQVSPAAQPKPAGAVKPLPIVDLEPFYPILTVVGGALILVARFPFPRRRRREVTV